MSFNASNIKWGWVALGVVIAFAFAYGGATCGVTGYATYLAFQSRGTPDQAAIYEFASRTAEGMATFFVAIGTLVGGWLAGHKAKAEALKNGLMVGLVTALIALLLNLVSGPNLWTLAHFILALGGGWLGGRLASRGGKPHE